MSGEPVELGDLSDLADGQIRCYPGVGDHGVVVCRVAGVLYALDDNCSHADTPLSGGRLRGTSLTCPLHGASFDVRDGRHSGPPAWEGVPCHRVEEDRSGARLVRGETPGEPDSAPRPLRRPGPQRGATPSSM